MLCPPLLPQFLNLHVSCSCQQNVSSSCLLRNCPSFLLMHLTVQFLMLPDGSCASLTFTYIFQYFLLLYCTVSCTALHCYCPAPFLSPTITFSYCTSSYTTTIHVILLTIYLLFLSCPPQQRLFTFFTARLLSVPFLLSITVLPFSCCLSASGMSPFCSCPVPHCYQSAM